MPTLLIVDDEPAIRHAFRRAFRGGDLDLHEAETSADAVNHFAELRPDVVVLDVHLPDASGLETFHKLRNADPQVPIILITGHGTTDLAIEAMKDGAFDYLLKPLELAGLRDVIGRAIRSRQPSDSAETPRPEIQLPAGDRLLGRCPAMQEVYKAIGRVAQSDVTVLITGESGTGKELVARALHRHSDRMSKPFVAINCGAIPENLVESELFGHERGAFTGADRKRIGRFEQAHSGTIFLDEIGELPPLAQVKLLRVLQERSFERVGGEETLRTDARVLAATNSDLKAMVEKGSFRQDLYFRLNAFEITLPPLRDRGDDIEILIDHYLRQIATELRRPVQDVAPEARTLLRVYQWPGNVRELQSVLKQGVLQTGGAVLLADDLPETVRQPTRNLPAAEGEFHWGNFVQQRLTVGSTNLYAEAIECLDREVLVRVLQQTGGNQLQAAKILGMTRGSLRTKIRALGIAIKSAIITEDGDTE